MEMRALAASIANHSRLLDAYAFLRRKLTRSQIAILMYHRVCPKQDNWSLEPLSPPSFEKQIEYFCRNYEIIPLEKLAQYIRQQKALPKKAVVITFDDGYKDNYLHAYPILKRHGVPATIFLATGYIATGKLLWWDKVSYIIHHTTVSRLELGELGDYSLQSELDKLQTRYIVTKRLNGVPEETKNLLIDKLADISQVEIPPDLARELVLSWEEIKEMNNNGVSFGAHSVSHPILTNIPLEQARYEIVQSKQAIETRLGQEVTAFAYPDGEFNDSLDRVVRESGYACAVTTTPVLLTPRSDPYQLGRIGVYGDFNKFKVVFSGLYEDLRLDRLLP
jgi:peptidoglycan/xylan/chitin deacetylase (PgdA/CDA1 family)